MSDALDRHLHRRRDGLSLYCFTRGKRKFLNFIFQSLTFFSPTLAPGVDLDAAYEVLARMVQCFESSK
jgi:hypothetical protein